MPQVEETSKSHQGLSEEVKSLIERKLHLVKREWDTRRIDSRQAVYSKLREEILAGVQARSFGRVLYDAPKGAYKTFVADAIALTLQWPALVWDSITSILDKAPNLRCAREELDALVDRFAWSVEQAPFTLDYIDPSPLLAFVDRETRRYGLARKDTNTAAGLQPDFGAATAAIRNAGKQSRNAASITIDEYLLSQGLRAPTPVKAARQSPRKAKTVDGPEVGSPEWRSQTARKAADAKHDQSGGSREKQRRIRQIWATGKYSTRERCAEEERAALGMSFDAARKALRNTPDPER